MKIGDKVIILDGSYSMCSDNDGCPKHASGNVLIADGEFDVVGFGCYDDRTDDQYEHGEVNDLMLRCVKNPDRIVWTQMRFCSVV